MNTLQKYIVLHSELSTLARELLLQFPGLLNDGEVDEKELVNFFRDILRASPEIRDAAKTKEWDWRNK